MNKPRPDGGSGCARVRARLVSLAERRLPEAELRGMREHLEACPDCASLLRRFAEAWDDPAPPLEPRPSADFLPRLMARIEAEEASPSVRPGIAAIAWRVLRPAAAAALVLAGILAGHELGKTGAAAPRPEDAFTDHLLQSFESIPPLSPADFYVNGRRPGKEGLE